MGVLLLLCTSLLWLGDISMMSSALLRIKGSLNVAGLLSVAGLLRNAGLLKCPWTSDVLIASNFPIANDIAIAS